MTRATPSSAGGWLGIVHRVRREVQRTRKKNEYAEKKGAARISCLEKRVGVGWGGSEVAAPIVNMEGEGRGTLNAATTSHNREGNRRVG